MAPQTASLPLEAPLDANPPLFHIPPGEDYNPAPSRNAVWTVLAVFGFFGMCSILLGGWMHFVERGETDSSYYFRRKQQAGYASRRGLREWYRAQRSRSNSASSASSASSSEMFVHPNKPPFYSSKRWHQYNQQYRRQQRADSKFNSQTPLLFGHEYYQEQGNGYSTFPTFDDEDLEAGPCDCGSPECSPSRRPTAVRIGKPEVVSSPRRKERRGMRRSQSSPILMSGDCAQQEGRQEDRPKMAWKYDRRRSIANPRRKSGGLDVVLEEAGTTPER